MTDGKPQRTSLFKETWNAIKATKHLWWRVVVVISLLMVPVQWAFRSNAAMQANEEISRQFRENPDLFKQHPELSQQMISNLISALPLFGLYLMIALVVYSISHYILTVMYLRFAMVKNQPAYSVNEYFHWLGQMVWKYIRPILWNLIPIIGMFFYWRSLVRYNVVSPLAILRRSPELKTSWDMTKNNWWRIFLNQLGLYIVAALIIWGLGLIPIIVSLIITHGDKRALLAIAVMALLQGIWTGTAMMLGAIYSCTVYRVLLKESRATASPAPGAQSTGGV